MDLTTIIETATPVSLAYFFLGGIIGYILRTVVSGLRMKKPNRYEAKAHSHGKRPSNLMALDEPKFELPDSVLKSLTPSRLNGVILEEKINEL